jgi:hypothetical protein
MKRTIILSHPVARQRALDAVKEAPEGIVVTLAEPSRNSDQNALLHALIGEIASTHDWAGKKRDAEIWKRLLVAAWCRVRGESMEILPALDGHGVDIVPARTSGLSKSECADLISYIQAWQAEHEAIKP